MKRLLLVPLGLLLAPIFTHGVAAKEWRGIVPLHSTRADVARLFNTCFDREGGCTFRVGNEEVYIVFSSGAVVSEYYEYANV